MTRHNLSLRPHREDEIPFLLELYCVSRDYEMQYFPMSDEEKRAFLESQFECQQKHYLNAYHDADFMIVELDGVPIGRWYVHRCVELRLMEVTLLREYRNRGIGTQLVQDLLDEAKEKKMRVSLHVEPFNPALHLYQRMGFVEAGKAGIFLYLENNTYLQTSVKTKEETPDKENA